MLTRRLFSLVAVALLALATMVGTVSAQTRKALVVGNSAYVFGPLRNPVNDATDLAAALRGTGFDVTLKIDADRRAMTDAIGAFGQTLKGSNAVGLFFFAGHGVQIDGENYLVPVGDRFASEADLKARAVKATDVVDAMAAAGNDLNIVVLDACRDNALGKSRTRGLSRVDTNARLFMSYSTSPGAVAQDGTGRNSPYAKHMIQAIGVPGLTLEQAFKSTLKGVFQETRGEQTPWMSSSFFGDFVFRPTPEQAALKTADGPGAPLTVSGIYRLEGRNPGGRQFTGMAAVTQTGDKFAFRWWVGKRVLEGTGHQAGRMLVINFGDKSPIVYTPGALGSLDGEWADGSGTERLTPHARASSDPVALNGGAYTVIGYDPKGRKYQGTVGITRQGERYQLDWKVGANAIKGEGTRDGNLLTVNWGGQTPIVYALAADGSLHGLWDAGAGVETLTPATSSP